MATTPFPVFLDLAGRPCVVVGAGRIAVDKIRGLLEAGADVTVVAPRCAPEVEAWAAAGAVRLLRRPYHDGDLAGAWLAIAATSDPDVNRGVHAEGERCRCLVNVVDVPSLCHYVTPSVVRRGALSLAISTQGVAPALAATLRRYLERTLGPGLPTRLQEARLWRRQLNRAGTSGPVRRRQWYAWVEHHLPALLSAEAGGGTPGPARPPGDFAPAGRAGPGAGAVTPGTVGLNLLHAPLETLESVIRALGDAGSARAELRALSTRRGRPLLEGLLVLTTRERAELWYTTRHPRLAGRRLRSWLAQRAGLDDGQVRLLRAVHGTGAVRHWFATAAGLESVVPLERETAGALRRALRTATGLDTSPPPLERAVRAALAWGRRAAPRDAVMRHGLSLEARAVQWLNEHLPGLSRRRIAVVDAGGRQPRLVAALRAAGVPGSAVHVLPGLEGLPALPGRAPCAGPWPREGWVLVVADAGGSAPPCRDPIAAWRGAMRQPLAILDLAVPRATDGDLGRLHGVVHWTLEALADGWSATDPARTVIGQARARLPRAADGCAAALWGGAEPRAETGASPA